MIWVTEFVSRIDGITFQVTGELIGAKRAVLMDGVVFVSPAMWQIIGKATPREREDIYAHIPVLDVKNMETELKRLTDDCRCDGEF